MKTAQLPSRARELRPSAFATIKISVEAFHNGRCVVGSFHPWMFHRKPDPKRLISAKAVGLVVSPIWQNEAKKD
jgi:hypothetical protein